MDLAKAAAVDPAQDGKEAPRDVPKVAARGQPEDIPSPGPFGAYEKKAGFAGGPGRSRPIREPVVEDHRRSRAVVARELSRRHSK